MPSAITTTFKSGNSVALRLPRELGVEAGQQVRIEKCGNVLTVRPLVDPAEEKRQWLAFLDQLARLPKPPSVQEREPVEFPARPGL